MRMGKHLPTTTAVLTLLACALTAAAAFAAVSGDQAGVVFTLKAPDAREVFLAGDFNGWNATAQPLAKGDGGVWTVTLALDPGQYEYKYVVDGQWREDPDNPEKKSDPFGGSNSLLTIAADGTVAAKKPAAPAPAPKKPAESGGDVKAGRPRAVDGGVLFTWGDAGAGSVFLAGSFNDWNSTADPLTKGGNGVWSIVKEMPAGKHEYKFVVDGAWFADPENPDTQADPYGGANSLVTVDDEGNLIESEAAAADEGGFSANTALNARVSLHGRYLTRFEVARGLYDDPRYRMQRPMQTIDLNFLTQVSDVTESMFRMRLDSSENIIQNNIAAFLNEAYLQTNPGPFLLRTYWNQETFTGEDPMRMGGDIDLPGTIGPDHLDFGKGTVGFLFEAEPFGARLRAFLANVYNQDYYNDPDLFDNTGQDRIGVRLSRDVGPLTIGLPAYLVRALNSYQTSELQGDETGSIPAFDDYMDTRGENSANYDVESHEYNAGLDLSVRLPRDLTLRGEGLIIDERQAVVWGDQAGPGGNGEAIDIPFNERQQVRFRTQLDWTPEEGHRLMAQHTWGRTWGAKPEYRELAWSYKTEAEAGNRVYPSIQDVGPEIDRRWTELEYDWQSGTRSLKLWGWRRDLDYDYAPIGRTVPGDDGATELNVETWYLSARLAGGDPASDVGRAELEFGTLFTDSDLGRPESDYYEMILRYDLDLTRRMGFIANIRYVNFPNGPRGDGSFLVSKNQYVNPFFGVRYHPIRPMELVLAYGVDPIDFSIDYAGREIGRWWYRQRFLFDHPDATTQDAEAFLADARVFTLRAQVTF